MTEKAPSIDLAAWLQTPPGRHLLAWEQAQLDAAVADLFGFHALQLGLPELNGLQANRMTHRWQVGRDLHCEPDALPFATASLDLVLLPHALEQAADAHALLREVDRVLRPEGRLILLGLNPASLWGMRQKLGPWLGRGEPYLPRDGEFIGYWRLRDWLKLLNLEVEAARFGVYRPPLRSEAWLQRWAWVDGVGARWWPVLGAVYFIQAVKRVRGTRMIGLARNSRAAAKKAAAVALNNQHKKNDGST
ncbi:class I SAM-dependent methyltransferase [Roseateles sp. BYS87W]|uniref:Class I SAM-dependent methyltransferase n=1 Tax=Pelomonas baiyunensis TaxID=3299026 RepID=A0ABW7GVI2_9BURK